MCKNNRIEWSFLMGFYCLIADKSVPEIHLFLSGFYVT